MMRLLPKTTQKTARIQYRLWKTNPYHASLNFKRTKVNTLLWSVRVNDNYRALCFVEDNTATWFWIGKHSDYEALLQRIT